jgi:hypothetical protein
MPAAAARSIAESSGATTRASATPTAPTLSSASSSSIRSSLRQVGRPPVLLNPSVRTPVADSARTSSGGGEPLAPPVQGALERSLQANFDSVRVHTDISAQSAARNLSARAFTVGNHIFLGAGAQPTDVGLMAHEATHVVQQQGAPALQRSAPGQSDAFEQEAHRASAAVLNHEQFTVNERTSTSRVQRLGLSDALNYFADKANIIPGFRMFTIVLGVNPINMSPVDRSAANILRAVVEFIPGGGLITEALNNHGIFEKVGGWIGQQIKSLGMVGSAFRKAVTDFLDTLSWRDIFDLGGVWNRAKRIFTEPIDRLITFAKGLLNDIVKLIKDAILMPLAKLAEGTRGWDLLIAVLGKNPITGEAVPRTAETLIGGFMKLIGEEEVWENMKKANAIGRAWAWFQGAMSAVMGFVQQIPTLAVNAFKSLELMDIVLVPRAFAKVAAVFGNFIGDFIKWAGNAVWKLLEIIFEVVAPKAIPYLKKAADSFKIILKNPIGFVGNLVKAGKLGFETFAGNVLEHLKAALVKWITGPLGEAGVYIPKSFSLLEIVKLVLSVLGLTWQNIRAKLVKIIPEPVLVGLEKTAGILVTLVKDGPAAAWEQIKAELTELKDQMIAQVTQMVRTEVVKAAVVKLVSMLNPAGAVVQAILAIYNTISFFIEKINQIAAVVASFIDSISAIAAGQVASAAKKVEQTMANTLTVIIAFLAKFVGLGNVPNKLVGIIKKIRQPIDKGLDKIVGWLANMLKKLVGAAKAGAAKIVSWWKLRKNFSVEGETHSLYFTGEQRSARLVVASAPLDLKKFLVEKADEAKTDAAKAAAIKAIYPLITKIEAAEQLPENLYDQAQKQIEAAMNEIGPYLVALLSSTETGTDANPVPIEYTKRRAGTYPSIYIGPKTSERIPQDLLVHNKKDEVEALLKKPERDSWIKEGRPIRRYIPTKQEALPGGPVIGLSQSFQVEVGKKIEYKPGNTEGGRKINAALEPFGYRARSEGKDGDHVVEMQIGGPNELFNLWPLDKGENRSSGSLLAAEIERTKSNLNRSKKTKPPKGKFYLLVVKTKT